MLIEQYLSLDYEIVLTPDGEGGYVVSFPDLPGCLSCGRTKEEALENARDAQKAWFEAAIESDVKIANPRTRMK